jgi:hypothetical protein
MKKANPFTGFRRTTTFCWPSYTMALPSGMAKTSNFGPYLIVNGALNFTHGERLAWQERKAASFVFTPQYCGYDGKLMHTEKRGELGVNAFRPTNTYAYPVEGKMGGIHLGTSMAISGAAASPSMGNHTSTVVAFLLTLFDVRLGWWLGNPRHGRKWLLPGPRVGLLYL